MTQNQINFAKVREDQRHNLATEGYTAIELAETNRHNIASEGISSFGAAETERHNIASENLNWYSAQNLRELQQSQAASNYAQAGKLTKETSVIEEKLAMDRENLNLSWQKLLNDYDIATRNVIIKEEENAIARDKAEAYIDDLMLRYNLDMSKYVNSGYYLDMTRALANAMQAGKDATVVIPRLIEMIVGGLGMLAG